MPHYFTKQALLNEEEAIDALKKCALPLNNVDDLQPLMDRIGDARIVMLGESSHGTHEYYTWRSHISKRLIEEKGFSFIAVEGDWPDCYLLNRFIKDYETGIGSAFEVMNSFNRWPTWMWANWETVALAGWLKRFNNKQGVDKKVGFFGLDVYSLWESMESIMRYLKKTDPAALKFAEKAFQCFEPYRKDEGSSYASISRFVSELCENEVVQLLQEIRKRSASYNTDHENVFSAGQNALIAVNAEKYYRAMIKGGPHSWNLRDRHMADTLDRLLQFHGKNSKAIVWAHNTHVGDARATDMVTEGMFNIGELARLEHEDKGVILVGFGTYKGSVTAGRKWGAKTETIKLPEAARSSWEYLLHRTGNKNMLLLMDTLASADLFMENHINHRAVGVVYNPEYEKFGNYVPTILPLRYDAFIYIDETIALHPLHVRSDTQETPETYPFGV